MWIIAGKVEIAGSAAKPSLEIELLIAPRASIKHQSGSGFAGTRRL
jgi:hypothetical protein